MKSEEAVREENKDGETRTWSKSFVDYEKNIDDLLNVRGFIDEFVAEVAEARGWSKDEKGGYYRLEFMKRGEAVPQIQDPFRQYKYYLPVVRELILRSIVDQFSAYLSSIVTEVYLQKPETLFSRTIEVKRLLTETREEIIASLAEQSADEIQRSGFVKYLQAVEKTFGVSFALPDGLAQQISRDIMIRNLLVHNRGRIDRRSVTVLGLQKTALGRTLAIEDSQIQQAAFSQGVAAFHIDRRLTEKFDLPRRPLESEDRDFTTKFTATELPAKEYVVYFADYSDLEDETEVADNEL